MGDWEETECEIEGRCVTDDRKEKVTRDVLGQGTASLTVTVYIDYERESRNTK